MNLFELFRRKTQLVADPQPGPVGPIGEGVSGGHPAADSVKTAWSDAALEAGRALRLAVENSDSIAAKAAAAARSDAEDRARGYAGSDGFILFDAVSVELALTFHAPETVGFDGNRLDEVRLALAFGTALGVPSSESVLATLLGAPLPAWEQFETEKAGWLSSGVRPSMWAGVLLEEDPDMSWQPESLSNLSFDARQVLALPKLVRRRIAVTRKFLAERTLLPEDRMDSAILELTAAGLASTPTAAERLSSLTVEQLKVAMGVLEVAARGTKAALVKAIAALPDGQVNNYLMTNHPDALQCELTVGIGADKAAKWLVEYSTLMAHWLVFSLTTARWTSVEGNSPTEVLRADDCPECMNPKRAEPPFHIGCRCILTYAGMSL
ncbi:hypothetical protein ABH924_004737 [Arthrobacter sp. GAS37]|uniref:hypothetical protein n=1 Tax=Arthrobacter sp. GAS37 TaxID=3156261 RepID=UPI003836A148